MLQQSFTYQLASISEDAIKPAAKMFERRFGLDVQALRVLRLVGDQPGVNFTTLAAQTRFERSATSRILSRLIKAALVRRELDECDARQFRLFITDKGIELRQQADPLSLALEDLILSALAPDERVQFRQTLDKLSDWLARAFVGELTRRYPDAGAVLKSSARSKGR
ncbi:MAG: MarR family transcriptional regulator [Acetobacteraceae bacterium]|nr:MarR family transcriptional regulator [Acetobacteraceae bacterium]